MSAFVDETVIEIYSGAGGNGAVTFRREKYAPRGGPDGGDGGKGGDVIFIVRRNLKTLSHIKAQRVFKAKDGEPGRKKRCHGKNGADSVIEVSPGTLVKDFYSGGLLLDLTKEGESCVFLKGGKGGKGNWHFATSTNQAPRFAQKGEIGKHRKLLLELNLIADIGLIGLPNAGKSTLLSVLTSARPEIAAYPFTTKIPNLGVIKYYNNDIIVADIPGIIRNASKGAGLGIRFLKHVSRTFFLAFLIDLSDDAFLVAGPVLEKELKDFSGQLMDKPRCIIGTKMDITGTGQRLDELKALYRNDTVIGISAVTRRGLEELITLFAARISSGRESPGEA
ncbi:MAG: GTPase ObgE [Spirochaetales bacterium]|nr:GTPase ObgE [Spirochaetales bacterium]